MTSLERDSNELSLSRRALLNWSIAAGVTTVAGGVGYNFLKPKEIEPISNSHVLLRTEIFSGDYNRSQRFVEGLSGGTELQKLLLLDSQGLVIRELTGDSVSWSPDGRQFLYRKLTYSEGTSTENPHIDTAKMVMASTQDESETPVDPLSFKFDSGSIVWHPDGSTIFFSIDNNEPDKVYGNGLWGYRFQDQQPFKIASTYGYLASHNRNPIISPDGKNILFVHSSHTNDFRERDQSQISIARLDPQKYPYQGEYYSGNAKEIKARSANPDFISFGLGDEYNGSPRFINLVGWTKDSQQVIYSYETDQFGISSNSRVLNICDLDSKKVQKYAFRGYMGPEVLSQGTSKVVFHNRNKDKLEVLDITTGQLQEIDVRESTASSFPFFFQLYERGFLPRFDNKPYSGGTDIHNLCWTNNDQEILFSRFERVFRLNPDGTNLRQFSAPTTGWSNPYHEILGLQLS